MPIRSSKKRSRRRRQKHEELCGNKPAENTQEPCSKQYPHGVKRGTLLPSRIRISSKCTAEVLSIVRVIPTIILNLGTTLRQQWYGATQGGEKKRQEWKVYGLKRMKEENSKKSKFRKI